MRLQLVFVALLLSVSISGGCSSTSTDGSSAQGGRRMDGDAGANSDQPGGASGSAGQDERAGAAGAGVAGAGVAGAGGTGAGAGAAGAGGGEAGAPTCSPWTGDAQFGTGREDTVLALASTARGVVVGGYFDGTLGVANIEPSGNSRGFVRGLSTSGAVVWESLRDTPGSDTVEALAVNGSGAVLSAGRTDRAFPGFSNQGQQDAFVALNAPTGESLALYQFGDARPQHPRRVAFNGESGAVIGGYDDNFVPTNYVEDWENPFFATVRGLSSTIPSHSFVPDRTPSPDFAEGLAVDAESGDVFLSGVITAGPSKGLFVRRQGSDGTLRWSARLSSIGIEISGPLWAANDGTLWLAAAWVRSTPTSDVVLMHLDAATGARIDSFDFPTEDAAEEVTDLVRDAHGDFWLAGTSIGPAFPGATAYGDEDAVVLHVATDGHLIDAWQVGTPSLDAGRALAIDACGTVILGGTTAGELVPVSALGATDAFVLRVPLEVRH